MNKKVFAKLLLLCLLTICLTNIKALAFGQTSSTQKIDSTSDNTSVCMATYYSRINQKIDFNDQLTNKDYVVPITEEFRKKYNLNSNPIYYICDNNFIYYTLNVKISYNSQNILLYELNKKTNQVSLLSFLPFFEVNELSFHNNELQFKATYFHAEFSGNKKQSQNISTRTSYFVIDRKGKNLRDLGQKTLTNIDESMNKWFYDKGVLITLTGIYRNNKKIAHGTDIGLASVHNNNLFYADFDGNYFYLNKLDLTNDHYTMLKRLKEGITTIIPITDTYYIYSTDYLNGYAVDSKRIEHKLSNFNIASDGGRLYGVKGNYAIFIGGYDSSPILYLLDMKNNKLSFTFAASTEHFIVPKKNIIATQFIFIEKVTDKQIYYVEGGSLEGSNGTGWGVVINGNIRNEYKVNLDGTNLVKLKSNYSDENDIYDTPY